MVGSMFSASLVLSKSKEVALRFGGEVIVEAIAIGECVRFMLCLIQVMTVHWEWLAERGAVGGSIPF